MITHRRHCLSRHTHLGKYDATPVFRINKRHGCSSHRTYVYLLLAVCLRFHSRSLGNTTSTGIKCVRLCYSGRVQLSNCVIIFESVQQVRSLKGAKKQKIILYYISIIDYLLRQCHNKSNKTIYQLGIELDVGIKMLLRQIQMAALTKQVERVCKAAI